MVVIDRRVTLKSQRQIEQMAVAGRLVADVLDRLGEMLNPGVTTLELDDAAQALIRERGGVPSFIGVPGPRSTYRHALCVSIDEQIVHGIPGKRRVAAGQIVSIDAGAIVDGWHGDSARTWVVGAVSTAARALVEGTCEAMLAGITAARPGGHIGDISAAVEDVALRHGYGIVRTHVGHGIGTEMHEPPQVENYRTGRPGRRLEPGLCLAIEPMFTLGSGDTRMLEDGWTIVADDGSLAAHWEHTIAITEDGPRILTTNRPAGERLPAIAIT
jgi:methionyl aminopeptidase